MRTILLLLISVAVVLPATESNPRVTRLMETFTASATAAEEAYQQAIQQAEAARAAALTTARDRTITGLKRLVNNRSGVAEQAEVYTQVLRLNREDTDAVRFFTAIGTLEQVLAGLEPAVETDLLGNVVGQQDPSSRMQLGGSIKMATEQEMREAFDFVGGFRYEGRILRLHSAGGLAAKPGFPRSFIIRVHAGHLSQWKPFDLARIHIYGNEVYRDRWQDRNRTNGGRPPDYIEIAYNADTRQVLITTDSGTELARTEVTPQQTAPAVFLSDAGSPSYGSNIAVIEVIMPR